MNWAHVHLILTHVPVMGVIAGTLVLLAGLLARSRAVLFTACAFFIVSALAALAVYFTGEPAEEVLEGVLGVSERSIEAHEQVALAALIATIITGAAAGTLWLMMTMRRTASFAVSGVALLVIGLADSALIGYTANLGGKIRHTEVTDVASTAGARDAAPAWSREREHDDDHDDD